MSWRPVKVRLLKHALRMSPYGIANFIARYGPGRPSMRAIRRQRGRLRALAKATGATHDQ